MILLVVGVLIVIAIFAAAPLGLASAGFGYKKIGGLVVGVIVVIVGLVLSMRKTPAAK